MGLLKASACLIAATAISQAHDALAQQLVTSPDWYIPKILDAPADDDFWIYVVGLTSGANAAWIAATGGPLFCGPHLLEDVEQTRGVLLDFLSTVEINETTILEAVAPMAFAAAYPCDGPTI